MFVIRAPLRISLAGGGSDLIPYVQSHGGQVVSFAIKKYVYLAFHETFFDGIRLAYSRTENVANSSQIEHPLFRNAFKLFNFQGNIEIGSFADVPSSGTGLGSSSAFTVALVAGLRKLSGLSLDKHEIANTACHIEIEMCGDPIGKQDQFASAFGGLNQFDFKQNGQTEVTKLDINPIMLSKVKKSLMLYYLGTGRSASEILTKQNHSLKGDSIQTEMTSKLVNQVSPMIGALQTGNINEVGQLLHENWALKKKMSSGVSSELIDSYYELGLKLGAFGGKVLGAGGGGFLLGFTEDYDKAKQYLKDYSVKVIHRF
jgi:D-glycero-alpha-D-manno-heptose-7-phosphate kinase